MRGRKGRAAGEDRAQRKRRIGPLVQVAIAHNQAEAEFIQGLLEAEGIPSMLKRSAGFDVPDFLAAGPRDVLVPSSAAERAREILADSE